SVDSPLAGEVHGEIEGRRQSCTIEDIRGQNNIPLLGDPAGKIRVRLAESGSVSELKDSGQRFACLGPEQKGSDSPRGGVNLNLVRDHGCLPVARSESYRDCV